MSINMNYLFMSEGGGEALRSVIISVVPPHPIPFQGLEHMPKSVGELPHIYNTHNVSGLFGNAWPLIVTIVPRKKYEREECLCPFCY